MERPSEFPPGIGSVPTYRTTGPLLLVCKGKKTARAIDKLRRGLERRNERWHARCQDHGYRNLQAAVDHVTEQGSRIKILPGVYHEKPTSGSPQGACADLEMQRPLSYEEQVACPHVDNLVSIFGDSADPDQVCDLPVCHLQIEGTGDDPGDVILDNRFTKLNGIRADRADGIYFRNFTAQNTEFNAIYVLETDGFVIDSMVGRWNEEYGFLSFASDHGLYVDCEAYGNGDGGVYPGSSAETDGTRWSIEVTGCRSHHNLIGYSGTAGNDSYVHGNWFYENSTGITTDSFAAGHPGQPQDGTRFEDNFIYSNNQDYNKNWRDGTCKKPHAERGYDKGVVCPTFQVPIGTGILIAGGNDNIVKDNWIYDNWRYGTMLFGVPATLRGEEDPAKEFDTSHMNSYLGNHMGADFFGPSARNGLDFWWDGQGTGNCWKGNVAAPGRSLTSDPPILPDCDDPPFPGPGVSPRQALIASCAATDPRDPDTYDACEWYTPPSKPS
ncbi:MAG: right-handed parallel beta-helix repeat-containing protein [Actinomycetota bacterium]